jgi:hypothetical protein
MMKRIIQSVLIALPMLGAIAQVSEAKCKQWSVDGTFRFKQSNGANVRCSMDQQSRNFDGLCTFSGGGGDASGSIRSNGRFKMTISWDSGPVGDYTGFVNNAGDIEDGRTFDRVNPNSFATWRNTTSLKCRSE